MVIYYSGTGNSKIVAEKIASLIGDDVICANSNIKHNVYETVYSDKPWVFVSPTYAWQIPEIFRNYIVNTKFTGNNKAYFVMTCGSDIGAAGDYLRRLCDEKCFEYMGVKAILMPENYIAMFAVPEADEAKQILMDAMAEAEKIKPIITEGQKLPGVKSNVLDRIKSGVVNDGFNNHWISSDKFRVIDEKCIGCGLCERNCPVNCVKMVNGKPNWNGKCVHCMACINGCPNFAIEYGRISVGKPRIYNGESKRK